MGLFDTVLEAASDYFGSDDGDEVIDTFRGFFSGDDGGGSSGDSGDGGGGWGRAISSFLGDSEDDDGGSGGGWGRAINSFLGDSEGGEDGGWGRALGSFVDRFSGDGGREGLWDRASDTMVEQFGSYLPAEVRNVAGQFFGQGQGGAGGHGSSWVGSLLDPGQTRVPSGWHAVANHPTVGHSYGEGGFGGFGDHSLANLAGNYGIGPGGAPSPQTGNGGPGGSAGNPAWDDGMRYIRAPGVEPGRPLGHGLDRDGDGVPDPRVAMPPDLARQGRYLDVDGDGVPDIPASRLVDVDVDGDGVPDVQVAVPGDALGRDRYVDTDGDGHPDAPGPRSHHDADGAGYPHGFDDRADYDNLVTTGAPAPEPAYRVPDDPTFPADDHGQAVSGPAPVAGQPHVEAPAGDFEQSIDDANQVDQDMGAVFDDLEGPA